MATYPEAVVLVERGPAQPLYNVLPLGELVVDVDLQQPGERAQRAGLIESCLLEGLPVVESVTAELLLAGGRTTTVRLILDSPLEHRPVRGARVRGRGPGQPTRVG
ncbi:hypothetical protein ACF1GW_22025 [Streptomyces achromogenes]|uniref:hypothetical protein n=1 Tax=Streptomyces achromogenes TaxID=67255 RepID=UPI0036FE7C22